jgi:predicted Zn-dependent protease
MDELTIASNLDPLSVATTAWLGKTALRVGRFGTAIDYANEALDEVPQRIDAFSTIAQAYRMAGEPKEAADAAARYARLARIAAALKHHPRWAALENAVHLPDVQ